MPTIIDLIANDIPGSFPLDPTSIVLSSIDPTLTVVDNNDGTVTVSGIQVGSFTFDYTVSDTNSNVSNVATVTVLIQPTPVNPNSVAGLAEWLIADDIVGGVNGSTIPPWPAAIGNNGSIFGTPLYVASGLNGLPAVAFNGNNSNGERVDFGDPIGTPIPGITAMIVMDNIVFGAGEDVPLAHGANVGNQVAMRLDNGNVNTTELIEGGTTLAVAPQWPVGGPAILTFRIDPTTREVYRNLVQLASGPSNGVDITNNDWYVGAGYDSNMGFIGDVSEVLVYADSLTDVDLLNVVEGLKQKYNIP